MFFCQFYIGEKKYKFKKTQRLVIPNFLLKFSMDISKIDHALAIVEIFGSRVMKP